MTEGDLDPGNQAGGNRKKVPAKSNSTINSPDNLIPSNDLDGDSGGNIPAPVIWDFSVDYNPVGYDELLVKYAGKINSADAKSPPTDQLAKNAERPHIIDLGDFENVFTFDIANSADAKTPPSGLDTDQLGVLDEFLYDEILANNSEEKVPATSQNDGVLSTQIDEDAEKPDQIAEVLPKRVLLPHQRVQKNERSQIKYNKGHRAPSQDPI